MDVAPQNLDTASCSCLPFKWLGRRGAAAQSSNASELLRAKLASEKVAERPCTEKNEDGLLDVHDSGVPSPLTQEATVKGRARLRRLHDHPPNSESLDSGTSFVFALRAGVPGELPLKPGTQAAGTESEECGSPSSERVNHATDLSQPFAADRMTPPSPAALAKPNIYPPPELHASNAGSTHIPSLVAHDQSSLTTTGSIAPSSSSQAAPLGTSTTVLTLGGSSRPPSETTAQVVHLSAFRRANSTGVSARKPSLLSRPQLASSAAAGGGGSVGNAPRSSGYDRPASAFVLPNGSASVLNGMGMGIGCCAGTMLGTATTAATLAATMGIGVGTASATSSFTMARSNTGALELASSHLPTLQLLNGSGNTGATAAMLTSNITGLTNLPSGATAAGGIGSRGGSSAFGQGPGPPASIPSGLGGMGLAGGGGGMVMSVGPDVLSSILSEGYTGLAGGSSFVPSGELSRFHSLQGGLSSVLNADTGHISTSAVEQLRQQLQCEQQQGLGGRPIEVDNLEKVGQGSFGVVYRGVWQGANVAIKYLVSSSTQQLQISATEALLSKLLAHPNVVQTFACKVVELTPHFFPSQSGAHHLHHFQHHLSQPHQHQSLLPSHNQLRHLNGASQPHEHLSTAQCDASGAGGMLGASNVRTVTGSPAPAPGGGAPGSVCCNCGCDCVTGESCSCKSDCGCRSQACRRGGGSGGGATAGDGNSPAARAYCIGSRSRVLQAAIGAAGSCGGAVPTPALSIAVNAAATSESQLRALSLGTAVGGLTHHASALNHHSSHALNSRGRSGDSGGLASGLLLARLNTHGARPASGCSGQVPVLVPRGTAAITLDMDPEADDEAEAAEAAAAAAAEAAAEAEAAGLPAPLQEVVLVSPASPGTASSLPPPLPKLQQQAQDQPRLLLSPPCKHMLEPPDAASTSASASVEGRLRPARPVWHQSQQLRMSPVYGLARPDVGATSGTSASSSLAVAVTVESAGPAGARNSVAPRGTHTNTKAVDTSASELMAQSPTAVAAQPSPSDPGPDPGQVEGPAAAVPASTSAAGGAKEGGASEERLAERADQLLESFQSGDGFGAPYLGGDDGTMQHSPNTLSKYRSLLGQIRAKPGDFLTQIVMEYCDRGSLQRAIDKNIFRASARWNTRVALRAMLRTAREIAQGMCHLHASQIVHGDLKPANVLLKSSRSDRRGFIAKVADFGLSKIVQVAERGALECDTDATGTIAYMAPEVLGGSLCPAADIYSFGVLLWQLVTAERPFADLHPGRLYVGVASGSLRLEWPLDTHPMVRKLGDACLSVDKRMRPSFTKVARVLGVIETVVRNEGAAQAAAAAMSAAAGATASPAAAGTASSSMGGAALASTPPAVAAGAGTYPPAASIGIGGLLTGAGSAVLTSQLPYGSTVMEASPPAHGSPFGGAGRPSMPHPHPVQVAAHTDSGFPSPAMPEPAGSGASFAAIQHDHGGASPAASRQVARTSSMASGVRRLVTSPSDSSLHGAPSESEGSMYAQTPRCLGTLSSGALLPGYGPGIVAGSGSATPGLSLAGLSAAGQLVRSSTGYLNTTTGGGGGLPSAASSGAHPTGGLVWFANGSNGSGLTALPGSGPQGQIYGAQGAAAPAVAVAVGATGGGGGPVEYGPQPAAVAVATASYSYNNATGQAVSQAPSNPTSTAAPTSAQPSANAGPPPTAPPQLFSYHCAPLHGAGYVLPFPHGQPAPPLPPPPHYLLAHHYHQTQLGRGVPPAASGEDRQGTTLTATAANADEGSAHGGGTNDTGAGGETMTGEAVPAPAKAVAVASVLSRADAASVAGGAAAATHGKSDAGSEDSKPMGSTVAADDRNGTSPLSGVAAREMASAPTAEVPGAVPGPSPLAHPASGGPAVQLGLPPTSAAAAAASPSVFLPGSAGDGGATGPSAAAAAAAVPCNLLFLHTPAGLQAQLSPPYPHASAYGHPYLYQCLPYQYPYYMAQGMPPLQLAWSSPQPGNGEGCSPSEAAAAAAVAEAEAVVTSTAPSPTAAAAAAAAAAATVTPGSGVRPVAAGGPGAGGSCTPSRLGPQYTYPNQQVVHILPLPAAHSTVLPSYGGNSVPYAMPPGLMVAGLPEGGGGTAAASVAAAAASGSAVSTAAGVGVAAGHEAGAAAKGGITASARSAPEGLQASAASGQQAALPASFEGGMARARGISSSVEMAGGVTATAVAASPAAAASGHNFTQIFDRVSPFVLAQHNQLGPGGAILQPYVPYFSYVPFMNPPVVPCADGGATGSGTGGDGLTGICNGVGVGGRLLARAAFGGGARDADVPLELTGTTMADMSGLWHQGTTSFSLPAGHNFAGGTLAVATDDSSMAFQGTATTSLAHASNAPSTLGFNSTVARLLAAVPLPDEGSPLSVLPACGRGGGVVGGGLAPPALVAAAEGGGTVGTVGSAAAATVGLPEHSLPTASTVTRGAVPTPDPSPPSPGYIVVQAPIPAPYRDRESAWQPQGLQRDPILEGDEEGS